MRLLFVIDRYFPFGGLQQDMLRLADNCAQRGHDVTILLGSWEGPWPAQTRIRVIEVSIKAPTSHGRIRRLAEHTRQAKRKGGYDVVVGFKKIPGLDVYFAGDTCLAARLDQSKPAIVRWLARYRTFLANERAVFGPKSRTEALLLSSAQAEQFKTYYQTPTDRLHVLPPGIHRQRLATGQHAQTLRNAIRTELGIALDSTLLLSVGSSFKTKGVDRTIRAMNRVMDWPHERHLAIIGEGKVQAMRRLAKRVGVDQRVHLLGGREDVPRFYHAADLLVHPARTENTGTVILEAMVCGLPQLVSGVCGFGSYVDQADSGLVCPEPFDQRHFGQLLDQALDAKRRQYWAQRARDYAQTHSLTGMTEEALGIILRGSQAEAKPPNGASEKPSG